MMIIIIFKNGKLGAHSARITRDTGIEFCKINQSFIKILKTPLKCIGLDIQLIFKIVKVNFPTGD